MIKRGRPFLTYGSTRIIDNGVKVTQEWAVYVWCVCVQKGNNSGRGRQSELGVIRISKIRENSVFQLFYFF